MIVLLLACKPEVSEPPEQVPLAICINEFMGSNDGSLIVEGETPDWIELHLPALGPIELDGWGLSDDPEDPYLGVLDGLNIDGGGFLVLYADAVDAPLHLPFALDSDGGSVVLTSPEGSQSVVDHGSAGVDVAFSRASDCCEGEDCWESRTFGSPGESNDVEPEPEPEPD